MLRAATLHVQFTFLPEIVQDPFRMALDLKRLRLLRELAARGTVAAVADALAYSPSAVSQGLAALQREVGVTLLEPAGRGVRLTEAGRVLAERADGLLREAEAAEAAALGAGGGPLRGTVRVGTFLTAALRIAAPALRAVADAHPEVRVELVEAEFDEAVPALRLQALDVVVAEEYLGVPKPRPDGLHRERLLRERIRLLLPAGHPLAAGGGPVALGALRDAAWATGQPGTGQRELTVRLCRAAGDFEPDLRHASNDLLLLLAMVGTLGAVSLLPDLVRGEDDPAVAVRALEGLVVERDVFLLTRSGARPPAVQAVVDALRATLPP
jgi:DNA-binding transcriptional LysR family regulator